ncbi:MAG: GAF domain-containing protein [Hyphomicrobiales bacterium]
MSYEIDSPRGPAMQASGGAAGFQRSEERARLAQWAAGMGTWDWDISTGRLEWSGSLEALYGFEPRTFPGTFDAFVERLIPEDRPRFREAIEESLPNGDLRVELRVRDRDGGLRWIAGVGCAIPDENGEASHVIGVALDITERKASEEALAASEERFRTMANAAPAMIWVSDADRLATWFNQVWLDFTGEPLEHELGSGWLEKIHPDDRQRWDEIYGAARQRREAFETEYRLRRRDGEYRWVLSRATPLVLPGQEFAGYVGSCIDITDRKTAERSMRLLADAGASLTSSLDYQEMPARLAELAVPDFADWCTITAVQPDGRLERVAAAHRDPRALPILEQLEDAQGSTVGDRDAVAKIIRSGKPLLLPSITNEGLSRAIEDEEQLAVMQSLEPRSLVGVPLAVRGRTIGALMCVRSEGGRPYTPADLAIAEELARRAALAMDNARLYTDQQRANEALQLMADAGAQLASSLDLDEVLSNLARLVVPRFADWCTIDVVEPDGRPRRVVVAHKDPRMVRAAQEIQARYSAIGRSQNAIVEQLRSGQPVFLREIPDELLASSARDPEQLKMLRGMGLKSAIGVPLTAHGRTLGAIAFILSDSDRHYDDADFQVALQLGRRAALFVDNARLWEDSQRIESQLLKANEALRLLAEVGTQMGSSLEYEEALESLARLALPAFGDFCWIDVLEANGRMRRAVVAHRDPAAADVAARLREDAYTDAGAPQRVQNLVNSGKSQLYEEVTDEMLASVASSPEHLATLRAAKLRSVMSVPLRARGRVFGAITFCTSEEGRRYTPAELALAEDIAHRAGLFIDNARLYGEAQQREVELRRANDAKDEFLSMMSHELRTPLTVINGGARILRSRRTQLDETTRVSIIADIEQESDRLFRMVENLLTMAHIEFNNEVAIEPVLAQRMFERVIESFRLRRPERKVRLEVEPGLRTLAAEPTYLEQVMRNLLSNADKYSPADSPIVVTVASVNGHEAEIRVMDRGVGVDPEETDRIFERFYRSERTSKLVGGSGVGLALCKRLVEAMSGRIWASPRAEGGLEVGFTLPLYEESNA